MIQSPDGCATEVPSCTTVVVPAKTGKMVNLQARDQVTSLGKKILIEPVV